LDETIQLSEIAKVYVIVTNEFMLKLDKKPVQLLSPRLVKPDKESGVRAKRGKHGSKIILARYVFLARVVRTQYETHNHLLPTQDMLTS